MARRRRPPRPGALAELPPLRILRQMAALQGIYYAAALVLMLFSTFVAGTPFTMDLVFGWAAVRGDTTQGWLMGFLWILDGGLVVPLAIVVLIGRSKLVLDFALSLHLVHLVVATLWSGQLPANTAWWLTMAVAAAAAVALGSWGCRWRELRPISFGGLLDGSGGGGNNMRGTGATAGGGGGLGTRSNGSASGGGGGGGNGEGPSSRSSGDPGAGPEGDDMTGDEEQGYSRGRGRGRGRDGAGEFEMVKMNGSAAAR